MTSEVGFAYFAYITLSASEADLIAEVQAVFHIGHDRYLTSGESFSPSTTEYCLDLPKVRTDCLNNWTLDEVHEK
jgi:hypothetical protein